MKALRGENLKKILVIRTDHAGDLLLSLPFLKTLRDNLPKAEITLLLTPYLAEIMQGHPYCDKIIVADSSFQTSSLKNEHFDLAISLAPRTSSYKLAYATKARFRAGYLYTGRPLVKLGAYFWLTHKITFDIRGMLNKGQPVPHEIEQLRMFSEALGLKTGDLSIYYPLSSEDDQFGIEALNKAGALPGSAKIALHLHERWLSSWSLDNLADLTAELASLPANTADASTASGEASTQPADYAKTAGSLSETAASRETHLGNILAITFGPAEKELANHLKTRFREKYPHLSSNLAFFGNLSFKQWMSVLKASDVTVSPDTGAIHVAVTAGKPVVAVYEADTADLCSQQWAPWQVPHQSIAKKEASQTIPEIIKAASLLRNSASYEQASSNTAITPYK